VNRTQIFILVVAAMIAAFLFAVLLTKSLEKDPIPPQATPARPRATPTVRTPTPAAIEATGTPRALHIQPTRTPEIAETITVVPTPTSEFNTFYVAPDGDKENDGSKEAPWPLQYVLNHPDRLKPGDTVWIRGGEYHGSFVSHVKGEEGKPIILRAYPGERATLLNDDRVLDISTSHYVYFWGLEITSTVNPRDPYNRVVTAYGVRINQGKSSHHIKFINMIVHDMPAQGFGWWRANVDSEIYGSLIYFNGINQLDHGIYVHNLEGTKRIVDNIIFDNASHGIHAYGNERQELNNLHIEGNTVFNNGSVGYVTTKGKYSVAQRNILVGGLLVAENPVVINNYTYYPDGAGEAFNLGYRSGSENAIVENNYFAGGRVTMGGRNNHLTLMRNTILGAGLRGLAFMPAQTNSVLLTTPKTNQIFVRPNQYEAGRANLTIYNWALQEVVAITAEDLKDVAIKPGDHYELRNAQDFFGEPIQGVYDGEKIEVPMLNHAVAQPLGLPFIPNSTFPEFGAFVLLVTGE
jgi:hypothetical protein